jgi:hypothetical protein
MTAVDVVFLVSELLEEITPEEALVLVVEILWLCGVFEVCIAAAVVVFVKYNRPRRMPLLLFNSFMIASRQQCTDQRSQVILLR